MNCKNRNCDNNADRENREYCHNCVIAHAKMGISLK